MYESRITDLSKKHLEVLSTGIEEDIFLLGGWAVHQEVNNKFQDQRKREYIGSRDIDIGFHFESDWSTDMVKKCSFVSCIDQLLRLGFQWQGFRLYKDFDYDTLTSLTPEEAAKKLPFEIFKMYVDPIVDTIHKDFSKICGYEPIDEPLLTLGFQNEWFETHSEFDNIKVTLPHLLLAMKMNSVLKRTKDDKRIKDISDIYALMWYSNDSFEDIKTRFRMIYDRKKAATTISQFRDYDFIRVSETLGIPVEEIKSVFREFSK